MTTYYVDESGGSDSNNGTSTSTPWKSTDKVNDFAASPGFSNGDSILFKRGEEWGAGYETVGYADGSAVNWGSVDNLTFGAYGSGDLPTFDANEQKSFHLDGNGNCSGWTLENLRGHGMDGWGNSGQGMFHLKNLTSLTLDNIYADAHIGASAYPFHEKMIYIAHCDGDLEIKNCTFKNNYHLTNFGAWGVYDAHLMFLYRDSVLTTGSVKIHDNVFSGAYADCIQFWLYECSGWTEIYDNTFEYYGENAIDSKSNAYVKFYRNHCERKWSNDKGNSNLDQFIVHRRAAEWNLPHDNYVYENNFIGRGDDRGVSLEGGYNHKVYNNYFENHKAGIYLWAGYDYEVYNNVLHCPTYGGTRVILVRGTLSNTGFEIFNNTIYSDNHTYGIEINDDVVDPPASTVIEGNIIYVNGGIPLYHPGASSNFYPTYNIAYNPSGTDITWDGASRSNGWQNNIVDDPDFNSIVNDELWVQSGSPAIGAANGSNYSADGLAYTSSWPSAVATFSRGADPDIGAYEYGAQPPPTKHTVWGHDTSVDEDVVKDFQGNWTGTGEVRGSGDNERLAFESGDYMESDTIDLGEGSHCVLSLDKYQSGDGSYTVKYKNGSTEALCNADSWHTYSTPFALSGWIKIRIERA